MKFFQVAVLAALATIAGLLFLIYQNQDSQVVGAPDEQARALSPPEMPEPQAVGVEPLAPPPPLPEVTQQPKPSPRTGKPVSPPSPVRSPATPAPAVSRPDGAEADELAPVPPDFAEDPAPVADLELAPPRQATAQTEEAPPRQPNTVMLPTGMEIVVRLSNTLSTNRNLAGDTFEAVLDKPLVVDGLVLADKGSLVEGRVLEVEKAGRVKGVSKLVIDLARLHTNDGQAIDIITHPLGDEAETSKGSDAKKVAWGAGIGAVIGAISGGGKGAAIGAGAGAGTGAGAVLVTRGKTLVIPVETRLRFELRESLRVVEKL